MERRQSSSLCLERIVVGMDFSASTIDAASCTARHFAPDAKLVLIRAVVIPEIPRFLHKHVAPPDNLIDMSRIGAEQRMRELVGHLPIYGIMALLLVWGEERTRPETALVRGVGERAGDTARLRQEPA